MWFVKVLIIIGLATVVPAGSLSTFGQNSPGGRSKASLSARRLSAKGELLASIERSKSEPVIAKRILVSIQAKRVDSLFEYAKPDKFRLYETVPDVAPRESIEIGKQRYIKYKGEWVKVRKDLYPLREQFVDTFFPARFASAPDDVFKLKRATVTSLGKIDRDGSRFRKYRYLISYTDSQFDEGGTAFINDDTGLVEIVETEGVGLFGRFSAVWTYDYGKRLLITPPQSYIEKDWVN
jgi:hypothetical protein